MATMPRTAHPSDGGATALAPPAPPIPAAADAGWVLKWRYKMETWRWKWTLSLLSSALLAIYVWLFFYRVPLYFESVEVVAYSWGGVLAMLFVSVLLKAPRVVTQESGDKIVPITENVIALLQLTQVMYIGGKISTPLMEFPPTGQFAFWVLLIAVFVGSSASIYLSIRLAERTWEESGG